MIGPSASEVIAMRWRVRILLRLATLTLTIISLAWIALRLRAFLEVRQMAGSGFARSPHPLDFEWFAIPIAILAVAFVLALVAQFGLAMIVEVPRPKCPGCGYDLSKLSGDKCPECGLLIGRGDQK
ncbi:MAG: hypothetical protein RIE32_06950 [Phycisphaerales bacterium]